MFNSWKGKKATVAYDIIIFMQLSLVYDTSHLWWEDIFNNLTWWGTTADGNTVGSVSFEKECWQLYKVIADPDSHWEPLPGLPTREWHTWDEEVSVCGISGSCWGRTVLALVGGAVVASQKWNSDKGPLTSCAGSVQCKHVTSLKLFHILFRIGIDTCIPFPS